MFKIFAGIMRKPVLCYLSSTPKVNRHCPICRCPVSQLEFNANLVCLCQAADGQADADGDGDEDDGHDGHQAQGCICPVQTGFHGWPISQAPEWQKAGGVTIKSQRAVDKAENAQNACQHECLALNRNIVIE